MRQVCKVGAALGFMMPVAAQGQTFTGIGILPGTEQSLVTAVSADGSTVVGASAEWYSVGPSRLLRWRDGVLTDLGDVPGFDKGGARRVSANGSVIVGTAGSLGFDSAGVVWTEAEGVRVLPRPAGATISTGIALTGDGRMVVGTYFGPGHGAFTWTEDWGIFTLPAASGRVADVTADGKTFVGHVNGSAFLWTQVGGVESLGAPPAPWQNSFPADMTDDAATVVGQLTRMVGPLPVFVPFRWTRAHGYELYEGTDARNAQGNVVAEDGSTVVGEMNVDGVGQRAVMWGSAGPAVMVSDYLAGFGISTAGWTLQNATAISADGRTIAGYGLNPQGSREGWVARVPTRCAADLNADRIIDFGDYLEFLSLFDVQDPRVDFTGDGTVDFGDYLEFLNLFESPC